MNKSSTIESHTVDFDNPQQVEEALAHRFENLRTIEEAFEVKISSREGWVRIEGGPDGVARARELILDLQAAVQTGILVRQREFDHALNNVVEREGLPLTVLFQEKIEVKGRSRSIQPRTPGQRAYILAMRQHDVVFGLGPAGTGKTYLAMAMAIESLRKREVSRILLTRPAVEAGENLGFLPGDLQEKILPYLRPLYDALYDMMDFDDIQKNMDRGIIEIAPLAYMRGRTLNHSFIILDEAQNTTPEQMLMFLTRLGNDSKCVVTGDPSQTDLPRNIRSGLADAQQTLSNIPGIQFVTFSRRDVVRHQLVQQIIQAYENAKAIANGSDTPQASHVDAPVRLHGNSDSEHTPNGSVH
ncbi:MAG: PhoH family protein [Verrucomicrobiota bacterium]|jgi:phosphate starvation-inducible PhoH-like protein|nr:PhoH family protein [Verrucomicrobiota bacterium]MDD8046422.1 PhoH family protein [Verrucomicrobiota bacterium]MDD8050033.1 PhoH family protein [Verrucomicrobiota bacterium]MDI9383572.1 PhoH family protein [Verrucomicrobiota bacterium]HCF96740.1 phosphate starvation-inducible protein PhoH [Verrucomicrobiota bacterium]